MYGSFYYAESYYADAVGSTSDTPSGEGGGGYGYVGSSRTKYSEEDDTLERMIKRNEEFIVMATTQFIANNN